jgi:nucleotide-binding universal stress UspA family protein
MRLMQTILYATDFSEHSCKALDLAGSLARDHAARLVILHVVPSGAPVTGPGDGAALERAERRQWDLQSYQQEMAGRLRCLDVPAVAAPVERLLEEGDPATVILRTAEQTSCDLIVLGTHGKTAEMRRLMGSVAEEVMRRARCPVLTVKVPVAEPAGQPAPPKACVAL